MQTAYASTWLHALIMRDLYPQVCSNNGCLCFLSSPLNLKPCIKAIEVAEDKVSAPLSEAAVIVMRA